MNAYTMRDVLLQKSLPRYIITSLLQIKTKLLETYAKKAQENSWKRMMFLCVKDVNQFLRVGHLKRGRSLLLV